MKLLVCGGRDYRDWETLYRVLDEYLDRTDLLIHGGAAGADVMAGDWAAHRGVHVATVLAQWDRYGKRAGYLRNAAMLRLAPDMVIAFPGGKGTRNMVNLTREAGIELIEI